MELLFWYGFRFPDTILQKQDRLNILARSRKWLTETLYCVIELHIFPYLVVPNMVQTEFFVSQMTIVPNINKVLLEAPEFT